MSIAVIKRLKWFTRRASRKGGYSVVDIVVTSPPFAADALARVGGGAGAVCPRTPEDIFAEKTQQGVSACGLPVPN